MNHLAQWQNFYIIVGSAAGGLTGLQFIAMALIADLSVKPGEAETSAAFATPTIVHFVAVLLFSASTVMPWPSLTAPAIVWTSASGLAIAYMLFVTWRMGHQSGYKPVFEDWLFRAMLPGCGYIALTTAAAFLTSHPTGALFGIATALLLLLIAAIQNAWDNVIYLVIIKRKEAAKKHA